MGSWNETDMYGFVLPATSSNRDSGTSGLAVYSLRVSRMDPKAHLPTGITVDRSLFVTHDA
jgi:hypothetical protein